MVPALKSGAVIGEGGAIISDIRQTTGARIKVDDAVPGCEERIVHISGSDASAEWSSAEAAAHKVVEIITAPAEGAEPNPEESLVMRMLVPTGQIGCILGKGGSIITQLRQER